MAPSRLSTFTLSFGLFPELHCNLVLPSLHRGCSWQLCPFPGLSEWSAPFLRLLPDCCEGLKVYYCAQPHLQKAISSLASWIPPDTNLCPLKLWRAWRFLLSSMNFFLSNFKTYKPPYLQWHKDIFSNVCLWKASRFCWVADHIFKSRKLLSAPFCTIVHMTRCNIISCCFRNRDCTIFGKITV